MNTLVACSINDHVSGTEKNEAPEGICQVTGNGVDDMRICMSTAVSTQVIFYTRIRRRVEIMGARDLSSQMNVNLSINSS